MQGWLVPDFALRDRNFANRSWHGPCDGPMTTPPILESSMFCIVNARVANEQAARALIDSLVGAGIPSDSVHVIKTAESRRLRSHPTVTGSLSWRLMTSLTGGVIGFALLSGWSEPLLGSLWGMVIGGILGGPSDDSVATDGNPATSTTHSTLIQIDTQDAVQTTCIQRICIDHHAKEIMIAGVQ